jgi:NTP pyrophosphatase (non-canonical NTP hydrolase)
MTSRKKTVPKRLVPDRLTLEELLRFIEEYDRFFRRRYRASRKQRVLSRTVKLAEEVGELASAILASLGDQRDAKLKRFRHHQLADEAADVMITLFVLLDALGVDVRDGLRRKMAKIKERVKQW